MPKFSPGLKPKIEVPENLRPFLFHKLDLNYSTGGQEAVGTCIFCGRDNKLYVNIPTGKWNCRVCGLSGNAITFLRELYKASVESGSNYETLAADRKLKPETLERWGLVQSVIDGEWLFPGYTKRGSESVLKTLYRYSFTGKKRSLMVTSGFEHCLVGMQFFDPRKSTIHLIEGPWNVMAWEQAHYDSVEDKDNLDSVNLFSIPGASTFKEGWVPYFKDAKVIIICDSDHPKRQCKQCKKSYSTITYEQCPRCSISTGKTISPAGYNGMRTIARMLKGTAAHIDIITWGNNGYDSTKPSGYDLRDYLTYESNK